MTSPYSITSVWADWNTLGRPAVFCQELSHLPPPRVQVEQYRWMYNQGPGGPIPWDVLHPVPPEAAATKTAPGQDHPVQSALHQQPAEPASPIRPRGGWLFGRRPKGK